MTQKMQISYFLVKKLLVFYNFLWIFAKNSYILEGVSFEQHEEFQITLSLCVQFSEHVAKIYFCHGVSQIILHKLWHIFLDVFPINQLY